MCQLCGEEKIFNNYLWPQRGEVGAAVADHKPAPQPIRLKGGQAEGKTYAQATRNGYTREDFRRWGKRGGRGNKGKC